MQRQNKCDRAGLFIERSELFMQQPAACPCSSAEMMGMIKSSRQSNFVTVL